MPGGGCVGWTRNEQYIPCAGIRHNRNVHHKKQLVRSEKRVVACVSLSTREHVRSMVRGLMQRVVHAIHSKTCRTPTTSVKVMLWHYHELKVPVMQVGNEVVGVVLHDFGRRRE